VVLNGPDDVLAKARGEDLFLNAHEDAGLRASLLVLEGVHVHLVAAGEVGVVRRTDDGVQPERLVRHDHDLVGHDRHPVERRLAVEDDDVAVDEVAVDLPAGLDLLGELFAVLLRSP